MCKPRLDLSAEHRQRLIAEAQEHSRLLHHDPAEQALLEEVEQLQADNAAALED